ncbi:hypothetical protein MN116_001902 [Schistosoma mekongi]|uniref:Signal recognition particle 14 kDa protein n=1 Tax=Schistosoma mekongi TaxID=38744 RepID=A0AAE1ZJ09_SCHME|nr:hypothetical protein MN116_001902 [Schistosoma mekongi]
MLTDDQLLERSTNQTTAEAQQSANIKPSSMNDKHVNEAEETDIQDTIPPDEYAAEVSVSLVNDSNSPSSESNSSSRKILSIRLKNVMLSRIIFTLSMLCLLILGIILRFLTSLNKLFTQSKSNGSLYITMKRYDGRVKPISKRNAKTKDVHVATENSCLLRATLGNQKISTVVHQKDMNRFNQAYSNLLKANIDGLKKRDKRVKSANVPSKINRSKTEKG